MDKKMNQLLPAIALIIALLVLFNAGAKPARASESKQLLLGSAAPQAAPSRVICATNYLLMHEAQLWRLNFTLSDGRGNALGLRGFNPSVIQDGCGLNIRRLDFVLSDGKSTAFTSRNLVPGGPELQNRFNLRRLTYALSDGKENSLEFEAEIRPGISSPSGFNPRRLEFALNDGRIPKP